MHRKAALMELKRTLVYLDDAREIVQAAHDRVERWYTTDNPNMDFADAIIKVADDASDLCRLVVLGL